MRTILLLLCIGLTVLVGCSSRTEQSPQELNDQAVQILKQSRNPDELEKALALLDKAVSIDKRYLTAHHNRVRVLTDLGRLEDVVKVAEQIVTVADTPQNNLFLCMAKEASDPQYPGYKDCYAEVAARYKSEKPEPLADINYLFALKLAESENYASSAKQFLDSLEPQASRELYEPLLLEDSRNDTINDLFGP